MSKLVLWGAIKLVCVDVVRRQRLNVGELEEDIPEMMDRSFQFSSGPKELGIHVVCGLLMRFLGEKCSICVVKDGQS